jgi:2-amino-4-hydroxy-6-hydroxymethyldihydropteridine diphosphokinase
MNARRRRGVYVALGANLGDPLAQVRAALVALDRLPRTRVVRSSPCYRTPAWPDANESPYCNAVCELETELSPQELIEGALRLERAAGRVRGGARWAARTLDIDVLCDGDVVLDSATCQLPHPRAHERAFVLAPWRDLAPQAVIPGRGSVQACWDRLSASARAGVELWPVDDALRRSVGAV